MRRCICAVILLLGMLCLLFGAAAENGGGKEAHPAWAETVIAAYRDLIHQDWKVDSDIPYTGVILTSAWREYVDDPRSEPAWALCEIDGETVLLIGDRRDPEGTCRRIFKEQDGRVTWSPEGDGVTPFTLETEGKTVSGDVQVQSDHTVQIAWTRFWESRKAVVAAEAKGGLVSRTGLGDGSYTLGKQETGLVIVVDQVVDGWAWYRYHATRQGVSAASWGYIPEDGLVYMDRTDPTGTAVLAKNGKTSGKAKINVRFRPTTKARKILELPIGTQVDVYGSENGWTEIEWNRFHGYVKNEFLRDIE
ncbi:MAG: hypothetical protein IJL96_01285 [Clostridia bacterium]|nr:hypothetical protein [Clostridia bacterium]